MRDSIKRMAAVRILPAAQKEAAALPLVIRDRLGKVVARLEHWPNVSGAKPLRGALAGRYRIRTGDYRIQFFYESGGDAVIVERIGHRDGFYDDQ